MPGAVSRFEGSSKIRKVVPASTTLAVDTVLTASFRSLRYQTTAWGDTPEKAKAFVIAVVNNNGTITDSVYDRQGPAPKLSIGAVISGSDTLLNVTNPNLFDITVELIKFKGG